MGGMVKRKLDHEERDGRRATVFAPSRDERMNEDSATTGHDATASGAGRGPGRAGWLSGALWIAASLAVVAATIGLCAWIGRPRELTMRPPSIAETGGDKDLSIERIRDLVARLASLKSRVTGYGDRRAAEIILAELARAGIDDVQVQEFEVTVPIVRSASLEMEGRKTVPLHPLWPNLARTSQTPAAGLSGPLVYVGKGTDAELAGKKIQGAILVIDWDCDNEWLSGPEFGAKAVLFRANQRGSGYTARNKFLTVPANVPRFYVAAADLPLLDRLLAGGVEGGGADVATRPPRGAWSGLRPKPRHPARRPPIGTVRCEMSWQAVPTQNILARVCGDRRSDPADADRAPILFHAYYDSISVVPGLSPGAEQACGAAAVVELARFFARAPRKPRRPVYILLTGGHGQALSGMIHFVSQLRSGLGHGWAGGAKDSLLARMGRPGLLAGLDISSRSDRMGVFCMGKFRPHDEGQLRAKFKILGQKLDTFARDSSAEAVKAGAPASLVDCINLTLGRGWWTYFPYPAPFESEVATMAGLPGITLSTINDDRTYVDTPDDTARRLRLDMLERQLLCEPGRRVGLVNLALALTSWTGPFISSPLTDRWARIDGRVAWLDQERDYTPNEPLVRAVVFVKSNQGEKYFMGTRGTGAAVTDQAGRFRFDGISKP